MCYECHLDLIRVKYFRSHLSSTWKKNLLIAKKTTTNKNRKERCSILGAVWAAVCYTRIYMCWHHVLLLIIWLQKCSDKCLKIFFYIPGVKKNTWKLRHQVGFEISRKKNIISLIKRLSNYYILYDTRNF